MSMRVPPELLLKIFSEIQKAHFWTGTETVPSCWAVSQVCRQWRMVALESSRLWACIPLESPLWAKACLSRSRSSCLEVTASRITPEDDAQLESLALIYPELPRVSSLEFCTDAGYPNFDEMLREVLTGLSLHPAPKLRELRFNIMDNVDINRAPISLPQYLFASQKLTSLELASFFGCELSLSWSKTLLPPTLRSLTLHQTLAWKDIDEMVLFFGLVSNLEILHLYTITSNTHFSTSSAYPYRAATLPRLKRLNVSTRYLEVITILAYLAMPPTTSLTIRIMEYDWDLMDREEAELAAAISLGTRAFRDHFAPVVAAGHGYTHFTITTMDIQIPCMIPCELHDNHAAYDPRAYVPAELAPVSCSFGIPMDEPHLVRPAYAMLLEQPILETATTICVHGNLPLEAWLCFERWSAVETLELSDFRDDMALSGFAAAIHRQGFRLFKALRHLWISDCVVVEAEPDSAALPGESIEGEGLTGTDAREFIAAARCLADYEHFEQLTLVRCIVSTQALQTVKEILGEKRVDGDVRSPEREIQEREDYRNERDRLWFAGSGDNR
ncbi:hypothetical protein PENSPDRAFT_645137 [Peniophora sp. CONT]|nr:hypothetical protein PENSPDRAFT_645137 [Peniophora sp. CONT]